MSVRNLDGISRSAQGLIKRAILAETDPVERQKLCKCGTYALRKFSDKAEAKVRSGAVLGLACAGCCTALCCSRRRCWRGWG